MEINLDYVAHTNRIADYNPYVKVGISLFFMLSALILSNNYYSILVIILSSAIILGIARVSLKEYCKFLVIPFSFTFLTCLFILFFFPQGEYIWDSGFWGIGITTYSYTTSVLTFFRVFACFSALGIQSLTTPISDVMHVLRSIKVPKVFCEIAVLMYNAIFIFLECVETMRNAQKTRLGYLTTSLTAFKSMGSMFSNLFLQSLKKSETMQVALDSRCYTGELPVYKPNRKAKSYPELVN
ncbi:MAG: cobalt ECF transporter T component CbiQ [Methanobrevibacter boviskoreani]|jgi:cobalt/nickel transport system permease protein|uniref:cobalt ECF transporter T component CbiQ n=1 Tax=Methanobrevibacter boviskoreani TaxID=1348249 RepID=UPI0005954B72|nr:cobalt ECF transporter T component CbiQ [Methanobrevibacter boviskoreani]MCI6774723.1 cobalt ECF transporter T component CbiQ [Methanobrevibacter boviskoreani]MCI6930488.1 cobalt ECF transporter T component CbiQ [Methanobrevibacter boviskoreani]MDY5614331.1 cobalt ECF transporter T component CbiQ [Methanobrevibacter boviskoreani]